MNRKQVAKEGAKKRWEKKNEMLAMLKEVATREQYKYLEKAREKTVIAVGEIIMGLAGKKDINS